MKIIKIIPAVVLTVLIAAAYLELIPDQEVENNEIILEFMVNETGEHLNGGVYLNEGFLGYTSDGKISILESKIPENRGEYAVRLKGRYENRYEFEWEWNMSPRSLFVQGGICCVSQKSVDEIKIPEMTPDMLVAPEIPSYKKGYEKKPQASALYPAGINISIKSELSSLYVGNTGFARLIMKNQGSNKIFIYGVMVEIEGTNKSEWTSTGTYLAPGEEKILGISAFSCPESQGNHSYKICIKVLSGSLDGGWYDRGEECFKPHVMEIKEYAKGDDNLTYTYNPPQYFWRVNKLINKENMKVKMVRDAIIEKYRGDYNVYQLSALYDWVRDNIEYAEDPEDEDYWAAPQETIDSGKGDCDDHAILISAMIESIGGKSRIYMIREHMFASFYAGDNETTRKIANSLNDYYNAPLKVSWFSDEYGNWIVIDPTCSLYPGALPCSAEYKKEGWGFSGVDEVMVVDVISI